MGWSGNHLSFKALITHTKAHSARENPDRSLLSVLSLEEASQKHSGTADLDQLESQLLYLHLLVLRCCILFYDGLHWIIWSGKNKSVCTSNGYVLRWEFICQDYMKSCWELRNPNGEAWSNGPRQKSKFWHRFGQRGGSRSPLSLSLHVLCLGEQTAFETCSYHQFLSWYGFGKVLTECHQLLPRLKWQMLDLCSGPASSFFIIWTCACFVGCCLKTECFPQFNIIP